MYGCLDKKIANFMIPKLSNSDKYTPQNNLRARNLILQVF